MIRKSVLDHKKGDTAAIKILVAVVLILLITGVVIYVWQKGVFRVDKTIDYQTNRLEYCAKHPTDEKCLGGESEEPNTNTNDGP